MGRQKRPISEYTEIASLYVGIENWIILGRIISLNPLKTYINKKGAETSLLVFEIGDRSGVIECNIFGEPAGKF